MNIWILILIGISLSMDTFSLAISFGSFNITFKKSLIFSILVGIFHFIMPILGYFLGNFLLRYIDIESNLLLAIIFLFIAITMVIDLFSQNESIKLNYFNLVIYALSVSLDSFSVGIGLKQIGFAPFIFSIISFCFTYFGIKLGKFSYQKLGVYSKIIGIIIIFSLFVLHIIR